MDWKKELEILKKHQNGDEYGLEICKDAEDVMKLIYSQDHSGYSFSLLSNILNRLLKEKPLFPITDDPEEWGTEIDENQNNRVTSIFKNDKGVITDNDRTIFVDTYNGKNSTWHSGSASRLVDEMFPIELPYMPSDKPYYVYGKDMYLDEYGNDKTDEYRGSYNYTVIDYIMTPEGERIDVNKIIDERDSTATLKI